MPERIYRLEKTVKMGEEIKRKRRNKQQEKNRKTKEAVKGHKRNERTCKEKSFTTG
jgi:hypothetical protein